MDISDCDFPGELKVIPLRGHFFEMIGIRTPDNAVFLIDCINSKSTLDKYQISFIYDVAEYLNTLDKVEAIEAAMFVPAHADAADKVERTRGFHISVFLFSGCSYLKMKISYKKL